ncbi:pirin family protein [Candidatus Protochlamydia phocaeensis]|uniref:pirin family protein n=1 Tax=Candidatus Protochlamydia phocaeensis TaxID=1414722 RepID=UPI000838BD89|nr:pirin family protein [Candidatus Protochlamydia phocaeensis]
MPIRIRRSAQRGFFDHGWLKTFHTFSFGQYYDAEQMGFRSLRVLNEDFISPGVGFPLHSHQDMEIFSVVLEGGLSHQDDIGNGTILRPGKIQLMSAGQGVTHSEYNASDKTDAHFLQIWILPHTRKLKPSYQEKYFPPETRHNQWGLIISNDGRDGSLHIHQDVSVYLADLDQDVQLQKEIAEGRYGWLQVAEGKLDLNGEELEAGDGAAISQTSALVVRAIKPSKLVFLDLN